MNDLVKLFELCLELNTRTPLVAFFWYSGHVSYMTIEIGRAKDDYNSIVHRWTFHIDDALAYSEIMEGIKNLLQDNGCETGPIGMKSPDSYSESSTSASSIAPSEL